MVVAGEKGEQTGFDKKIGRGREGAQHHTGAATTSATSFHVATRHGGPVRHVGEQEQEQGKGRGFKENGLGASPPSSFFEMKQKKKQKQKQKQRKKGR